VDAQLCGGESAFAGRAMSDRLAATIPGTGGPPAAAESTHRDFAA